MNKEETIIESLSTNGVQNERPQESGVGAWKYVALGGVSGILMGVGLTRAEQAMAASEAEPTESEVDAEESDAEEVPVEANQQSVPDAPLAVAQMHNELSFGQAFAAARAEVGPGGVFVWHGGIYNTYTVEEWNAMSSEQKHDFAMRVNPEIPAHAVSTPTDSHPYVAARTEEAPDDDVHVVDQNTEQAADDVHIVGYTQVDGHLTVGLDTDGDGQADVAIIDMDDNQELSSPDLVVDREGNMATIGEIIGEQNAYMESPDMAEGGQPESEYPLMEI